MAATPGSPVPGLATMDVWYCLVGNGLTAGNFITVVWQATPSINSQLLIDQFTGGIDGTVNGWFRPDRVVQSSAAAETASSASGLFMGGSVTPINYPALIYFTVGTNVNTIPYTGGWSPGHGGDGDHICRNGIRATESGCRVSHDEEVGDLPDWCAADYHDGSQSDQWLHDDVLDEV